LLGGAARQSKEVLHDEGFRTLATLLCVLPVLWGLSAVQAKQPAQRLQDPSIAAGALHMSSREGAVLRAASLAPGGKTTGTITLTASDKAPIAMTLSGSAVRDSPGRNGGKLSNRLVLTVEDITNARAPRRIYRGKLSGLGEQRLGRMAAGSHRIYRFSVRFPDGGAPSSPPTGDNAYQGSTAEVDFRWTSRAL